MPELIHHPDTHRLGKKNAAPPRLLIASYLDVEQAKRTGQVPTSVNNSGSGAIALAMYLNDSEGDCTCAGIGNTLRVNSLGKVQLSDDQVQAAYVAVTGKEGAAFDPQTGANDNGCVEIDVLDYWAGSDESHFGVGGDQLIGHAAVNMQSRDEVMICLQSFGSIYPGFQLDVAQQSQPVWEYVPGSPLWGGHCPPIFDAEIQFQGSLVELLLGTWGAYKPATWKFVAHQCDEGHALITDAWIAQNESNPLVNTAQLQADLAQLKHEN